MTVTGSLIAADATSASPYPNRVKLCRRWRGSVSNALRVIGERLSQHLRVPVVIESGPHRRPSPRRHTVMNSQPDGYTVRLGG
jgi:hypothetical protein